MARWSWFQFIAIIMLLAFGPNYNEWEMASLIIVMLLPTSVSSSQRKGK